MGTTEKISQDFPTLGFFPLFFDFVFNEKKKCLFLKATVEKVPIFQNQRGARVPIFKINESGSDYFL
jgi:hypothetical protein